MIEKLPQVAEKSLEVVKNVGRFVLHRLDGAHGGWSELPPPANITVNGEQLDEQSIQEPQ